MNSSGYEEIEHTADWSLRVWGQNLKILLRRAAEGMFDLLEVEPQDVEGEWVQIELNADDRETLLVSWLEELLYLHETQYLTIDGIEFREVRSNHLAASVKLVSGTKPRKHIKAVTFHNLKIHDDGNRLQTEIVFDV